MKRLARDDQGPAEWAGASPGKRAHALEDLLGLVDFLPRGLRPEGSPPLAGKVLAVHRAFFEAGLPHAIGGALALAYYGEPRTTIDIDVNVFVPASRWNEVREALKPLGVQVEIEASAVGRDHEVRLPWDRITVHLFFSHDALHASMPEAVRQVPFAESSLPIVSPEHLVARKVTLDRSKDWLDIEAVLVDSGSIDLAEIEAWVRRLAGPDDPRLAKFQGLIRRPCT